MSMILAGGQLAGPDHNRQLLWFLAIFAAYLFVALYLYAPIKIRRNQTKDINIEVNPIEIPNLSSDLSVDFYHAARELAECGFFAVGHVTHDVSRTSQNSTVSLWINQEHSDSAQIIGVRTPSVAGIKIVTLVTYRTEFRDSTSFVTSNSQSSSCFPPDPRVSSVRCPGIHDLALLYRFHRARVDRYGRSRTPTLERVADAGIRLQLEHTETFQRLIQVGYYSLDQSNQRYVPTWKGAYLMTYHLLPPFKQVQRFQKNRICNRTLRDCGFGGLRSFRKMQS